MVHCSRRPGEPEAYSALVRALVSKTQAAIKKEKFMSDSENHVKTGSRRAFIAAAAAAGVAAPIGLLAGRVFATPRILPVPGAELPICRTAAAGAPVAAGPLKKINFAWNAGAPCLIGVTVAKEKGIFAKNGLDVELINYSGSTDQLLETLATGKADAAAGMALRWLKPLSRVSTSRSSPAPMAAACDCSRRPRRTSRR